MSRIPPLIALTLAAPAPAQFQDTPAKTYGAPEQKKKEHFFGGYLSATRQMPPLPYHPFREFHIEHRAEMAACRVITVRRSLTLPRRVSSGHSSARAFR